MIKLIVGNRGKGKTKKILDMVNDEIKKVQGTIVYFDKSAKHMYELNNKIRLIDVSEYSLETSDEFVGFIEGVLSQDHDLQQMYFDSFLKIACVEETKLETVIMKLDHVSEKSKVDFILSVSMNEDQLPEAVKSKIIVSL